MGELIQSLRGARRRTYAGPGRRGPPGRGPAAPGGPGLRMSAGGLPLNFESVHPLGRAPGPGPQASVCLVFINHPCPKMGAAASGPHEVVA